MSARRLNPVLPSGALLLMGALLVLAPFAAGGGTTLYPPWQSARMTMPVDSGSGSYANLQANTAPSRTSGTWATWANATTTNLGTTRFEVDGLYDVNVPAPTGGWTSFTPIGNITPGLGYYGWAYLTIGCYSPQGTGNVEAWLNESYNVYVPGHGWQFPSPQLVNGNSLFVQALSGACGQSYSQQLYGAWALFTVSSSVASACGRANNCTVALYLQMAFVGSSTNDAYTAGCLDFLMARNSCAGTHGSAGSVDLGSAQVS